MLAFEFYGALIVACFLLVGWMLLRHVLAAAIYRIFRDTYPPEAAQAPSLDEHFTTTPIDDLDSAVDWHRYEYEMKRQT